MKSPNSKYSSSNSLFGSYVFIGVIILASEYLNVCATIPWSMVIPRGKPFNFHDQDACPFSLFQYLKEGADDRSEAIVSPETISRYYFFYFYIQVFLQAPAMLFHDELMFHPHSCFSLSIRS